MTPKQERFVQEYLLDLNATQAAIRAGYSEKTAGSVGFENLKKPEIAEAVSKAMNERAEQSRVSNDRLLQELERMALFDIRKLTDVEGKPKPIQELDDDTAAAVVGLDIAEMIEDRALIGWVKKYKLADKKSAIELLMKHRNMLVDRSDVTSNGEAIKAGVVIYIPDNGRDGIKPD